MKTIKLIKLRRFGRIDIKPACEIANLFLELVNSSRERHSFTEKDVEIMHKLGFEVEYIPEI